MLEVSTIFSGSILHLGTSIDSGTSFRGAKGICSRFVSVDEVSDISELQLSIDGTISIDETSEEDAISISLTADCKLCSIPFSCTVCSTDMDDTAAKLGPST